ncbi:MAG: hypothetical protein N3A68_06650 [Bacteroidia bacterium]|jgi:hypothetical protein|nr:hypothetical protein [Bacteroidia bacterium]
MRWDTVLLAEPYWAYKVGKQDLPSGPEVVEKVQRGETLFVRLRFWEGPGKVRWSWGKDTFTTVVSVGGLPPDSVMPQGDFGMPAVSTPLVPEEPRSWAWLWGVVAGVLALLAVGSLIARYFGERVYRIKRRLWWGWTLWRHRPKPHGDFEAFLHAVQKLFWASANFHPAALLPAEVGEVQGVPVLREALQLWVQVRYQQLFGGGALTPEERYHYWQALWAKLRAGIPAFSEKAHFLLWV